ncbi:hypothetical protein NQ176_g1788 [Zarea fungicola]|uniref:Uncharacterized protein n=1 Tax=Zarea fungicola TaxID=93591 RepID=A0ACC1NRT8_9HYPO|nr:hypothetical protein NQ176_g1788 [Lecanicillium fungicola]
MPRPHQANRVSSRRKRQQHSRCRAAAFKQSKMLQACQEQVVEMTPQQSLSHLNQLRDTEIAPVAAIQGVQADERSSAFRVGHGGGIDDLRMDDAFMDSPMQPSPLPQEIIPQIESLIKKIHIEMNREKSQPYKGVPSAQEGATEADCDKTNLASVREELASMREKLASRGKELIHSSKTAEKLAHLRRQLLPLVDAYQFRD